MRILTILLLSTAFAGSAMAQATPLTPVDGSAASGTAATTTNTTITSDGKYVVGYEGRGDYNKNALVEKQAGIVGMNKIVTDAKTAPNNTVVLKQKGPGTVTETVGNTTTTVMAPTATSPVATAAAAPASNGLLSDANLTSDSTKAKSTATPATTTTAEKPAASTTNQNNQNNNAPMTFVGGRVVRQ